MPLVDERRGSREHAAVAFYEQMSDDCRPREAIERVVVERVVVERAVVKRVVAEGDLVVPHCRQHWPGDHGYAGIDIFRFDGDDRIVEHWDVLEVVPASSKNDDGMP